MAQRSCLGNPLGFALTGGQTLATQGFHPVDVCPVLQRPLRQAAAELPLRHLAGKVLILKV